MKLRPGLVTFVAVMMFILGSFHIVLALSEFSDSVWVISGLNTVVLIQSRIAWGIIGFTIGVIVLYAGFRFLSGGPFGWIVGYYFAALRGRQVALLHPGDAGTGVVVIVLDMLVIYGLAKHSEHFHLS
jgi:hypothetical protein